MSVADVERKPSRADAVGAFGVVAVGIAACWLTALVVGIGAGNCSAWLAIPRLCTSLPLGLSAAVCIAALPLFVFAIAGRPLAALLGLYIVLVPIDDALLVTGGLSITKIVGLAVAIAALATIVRRRARINVPYAALAWLVVVAFMALSLWWSIDPEMSLDNLVTIASAFALLFVLVIVPMNAQELRIVVFSTIFSGAVIGIVAMALSRHELSTVAGQVGRLYLSFGTSTLDPNRFGASLLLPIAMTVGAIGQSRGWTRISLFAALALALTAVYLSASRGTLVALGVMGLVAVLGMRRRLLYGSLLVVCAVLLFVIPSEISTRLYEGTGASGTGRTDIWRVALAAFPLHWLLGTGVGTFVPAYDRAFFLTYQPQFLEWSRDPHNLVMSTAVELGVVGLVLMAVALILQYRSVRLITPDAPFPWLRSVFSAALIGLVVAAMFVDVLATKFSWLLFTEMLIFAGFAARSSLPAGAAAARTQDG
jgi:O-antigen ligase